jgi:hypothetical protein
VHDACSVCAIQIGKAVDEEIQPPAKSQFVLAICAASVAQLARRVAKGRDAPATEVDKNSSYRRSAKITRVGIFRE